MNGQEILPDDEIQFSVSKETYDKNSFAMGIKFKVTEVKGVVTVKWSKVNGATSYKIYATDSKKSLKKAVLTIVGSGKTSAKIKKIDKKKVSTTGKYQFYVEAIKTVAGVDYSLGKTITAYTAGSKDKTYTNAKSITVKTKLTLKKVKP